MESNSLLAKMFREKVANMDYDMRNEATEDVGYSTGFLNFDYMNGYINQELVDGQPRKYFTLGITDGSYVSVLGNTGTGKSTFVTQIAANIARPFKTTTIFEDNLEGGMTSARRKALSRFTDAEYKKRYIVRNTGITIENFYQRIKTIHEIKTTNPKDFLYDTKRNDMDGNPIMKLEPTIYIIDSIPLLQSEQFADSEELAGKSSNAATAQDLTKAFKSILQLLKSANIILFGINHIREDVQMTMFPKKSPVPGLKQGERIPGGRTVSYLANNIIRMDQVSKLDSEKDSYKINGSIVEVSLIKSRSSGKKKGTRLVYDFDNGFDPWLSMLEYLKNEKLFYGSAQFPALDEEKNYSFRISGFRDKIMNDTEFRNKFIEFALTYFKQIPDHPISTKDLHMDDILNNQSIFSV